MRASPLGGARILVFPAPVEAMGMLIIRTTDAFGPDYRDPGPMIQSKNQASATSRALVLAVAFAGIIAGGCALVAFFIGWDAEAASIWKTVAAIMAIVCAVLGVSFAFVGGRR